MISDILQQLKKVCEGDESVLQALTDSIANQQFSAEQESQIYIYIKQAARKNVHAIYTHALFYDLGFGVKQDHEMAFLLMREAASHGHTAAIYEIGHRFLQGIGIEQNYQNALKWLSLAANSPHYSPAAMYALSQMYSQGLGVQVDLMKARDFLDKALAKGLKP